MFSSSCIPYKFLGFSRHSFVSLSSVTPLCLVLSLPRCSVAAMEANPTSLRRSVFRFKDGTARNTPRIPPAKWDEHRELLCSLYQNMTVDEMLAFMRTEHGFVVK